MKTRYLGILALSCLFIIGCSSSSSSSSSQVDRFGTFGRNFLSKYPDGYTPADGWYTISQNVIRTNSTLTSFDQSRMSVSTSTMTANLDFDESNKGEYVATASAFSLLYSEVKESGEKSIREEAFKGYRYRCSGYDIPADGSAYTNYLSQGSNTVQKVSLSFGLLPLYNLGFDENFPQYLEEGDTRIESTCGIGMNGEYNIYTIVIYDDGTLYRERASFWAFDEEYTLSSMNLDTYELNRETGICNRITSQLSKTDSISPDVSGTYDEKYEGNSLSYSFFLSPYEE